MPEPTNKRDGTMNESFGDRLDARLQQSQDRLKLRQSEMSRYMSELEQRQDEFNRLGTWLIRELVRPRLEQFASRFENARLDASQPLRCRCDLAHCVKFPATAQVGICVERDAEISRLNIVFDAQIVPVFVDYPRSDEIRFPLNAVDQKSAANWVEEKLFAFLEAYLELQWSDQYQRDNLVTDPVCGMRISKAHAYKYSHENQNYYFCAEQCLERFRQAPSRFVAPH